MSSFFKQLFPFMKVKKKKEFSYIIRGVDPNTIWSLVGELGDGSFGKVYKVRLKYILTINFKLAELSVPAINSMLSSA